MPDAQLNLTREDWASILDALRDASEEIGWDLWDTRNSDFYDDEDIAIREQKIANWDRLAELISPLTMETRNA
jgi:hypothetical protein